jgi:hypothetical protein
MPRGVPFKCSFRDLRLGSSGHGLPKSWESLSKNHFVHTKNISLQFCSDYEEVPDEFAITKGVPGPKTFENPRLKGKAARRS